MWYGQIFWEWQYRGRLPVHLPFTIARITHDRAVFFTIITAFPVASRTIDHLFPVAYCTRVFHDVSPFPNLALQLDTPDKANRPKFRQLLLP